MVPSLPRAGVLTEPPVSKLHFSVPSGLERVQEVVGRADVDRPVRSHGPGADPDGFPPVVKLHFSVPSGLTA